MTSTIIYTDLIKSDAIAVLSYRLSEEGVESSDILKWLTNAKFMPLSRVWNDASLNIHQRRMATSKQSAVLRINSDNGDDPYFYI